MRRDGNTALAMIAGAAFGGMLMYLADPNRGNSRRASVRQKMAHRVREFGWVADKGVRDLRNRTRGILAEAWSSIKTESVPDEVLIDRVRAKIGRAVSHPSEIEVTAKNGTIALYGPVLEHEMDHLIAAAHSVRGVHSIENRLEPHKPGDNIPGLEGNSRRRGARFELLQENWAPGTRLLVGTSGAIALAFPSRNRNIAMPARIVGGLMAARAITNLPLRRLFGAVPGRRALRFQKTVTIHEPVERVFGFWSNPENFSRIMNHIQEVKRIGENRFRWTVTGPGGTSATWESRIIESEPNRLLAWRSEPGSLIRNAGIIRFESTADGGTRIHLLMSYNPPAGAIGHALAKLFRVGPKELLDEDLVRMKSLFEHGKTRAHGKTVTRDQLLV
jgi:uncharacterized membrane protein/osmotically-inducible protein OsmY